MSIRDQALDFARTTVAREVGQLVDGAQAEMAERRANPHRWALFHQRMERDLPKIRWAARAHHRRMARRYSALAWADDVLAEGCSSARLAERLGLPR